MKAPSIPTLYLAAGAVGLVLGLVVLRKGLQVGGGILSGNNAVTEGATNAAGEPVTAYQGAGIFGTTGAVANLISGGTLASAGQAIGDLVAPTRSANEPYTSDDARRLAELRAQQGIVLPEGWRRTAVSEREEAAGWDWNPFNWSLGAAP